MKELLYIDDDASKILSDLSKDGYLWFPIHKDIEYGTEIGVWYVHKFSFEVCIDDKIYIVQDIKNKVYNRKYYSKLFNLLRKQKLKQLNAIS